MMLNEERIEGRLDPRRLPLDGLDVSSATRDGEAQQRGRDAYEPPRSPEDDHALWLALKIGAAMFLANLIATNLGFMTPTWSIILAAYLAMEPPVSSAKTAFGKVIAMAVGLCLGIVGAYLNDGMTSLPSVTFGVVGLVAGFLATRSANYLFAAVVATIITFTAQGGNQPIIEEAVAAACMIAIGCLTGPSVVWVVERLRAWRQGSSLRNTAT